MGSPKMGYSAALSSGTMTNTQGAGAGLTQSGSEQRNENFYQQLNARHGKKQPPRGGHNQGVPPGHSEYNKHKNNSNLRGKGGFRNGPKQLIPLDDGMDFEFAVKMLFRHIWGGEKKFLPSHDRIYDWVESVAPEFEKIDVIAIDRDMQEVRVEYNTEEPVNQCF